MPASPVTDDHLLFNAPIGFIRATRDGTFLAVNDRYATLLGVPREQLVGRHFRDFTFPDDLPQDMEDLRALLAGERPISSREKRYRRPDGTVVWARRHLSWTGEGFIAQAEDITREVREREMLAASGAASALLAGLRNEDAILRELPALLVPAFADICSILLPQPDGSLARVAVKGLDAVAQEALEALRGIPVPPDDDPSPLQEAFRTGEVVHVADYAAWSRLRKSPAAGYAQMIASMDPRSAVVVPLVVSGTPIGVLALGMLARSGRRFHAEELPALRDLGSRLALALDNARLFAHLQAAQGRAQSEAGRFASLADAVPQLVVETDAQGRYVYVNEPHRDFMGFDATHDPEAAWSTIHPDDAVRVREAWEASMAAGTTFEAEYRMRRHDGVYRWFLVRGYPKPEAGGWIASATDVDDLKRAGERLAREKEVSETLWRLAVSISRETDRDRLLQAITDEATRLTGAQFGAFFFNAEDDRGKSYMLYTLSGVPRSAFEKFPMPRNTPIFAPTFGGQGTMRHDDVTKAKEFGTMAPHHGMPKGHLPVRSYLAVPVVTGATVQGGLFFGHGEPGRFTAEHETIVERIATHAAIALDNARLLSALRDTDRRKDEFLAMLAHELRNPLAPIMTALEVLKMKEARGSPATPVEREIIERQARHLTRLVEDLLDVSRITRGKIELRRSRTDLAQVIDRAVEIIRPVAKESGHLLEVRLPAERVELDADVVRLAQVVGNLLSNAVRYSPPGSTVVVEGTREGGSAVIRVIDQGAGLDAEERERIFDLFYQVDPGKERRTGGLGIGLTVVKRLVEMHGGQVGANSAGPGQGSQFTVRLPVAAAAANDADRSSPAAAADLRNRQVLVVDDNVDAAQMMAHLLRLQGAAVDVVHDGPAAVASVQARRPDVALVDIGLPGFDGHEVARRIRAMDGASPLLVAVTGYGQDGDRHAARAAGFDAHFAKPVDPAALQAFLTERLAVR